MTTKAWHVRQVIKSFGGRLFRATELPKYPGVHATLQKFIKSGEIQVEFEEPSPESKYKLRKVYREICIRSSRINAAEPEEKVDPWSEVWPEFYVAPALAGKPRVFVTSFD